MLRRRAKVEQETREGGGATGTGRVVGQPGDGVLPSTCPVLVPASLDQGRIRPLAYEFDHCISVKAIGNMWPCGLAAGPLLTGAQAHMTCLLSEAPGSGHGRGVPAQGRHCRCLPGARRLGAPPARRSAVAGTPRP